MCQHEEFWAIWYFGTNSSFCFLLWYAKKCTCEPGVLVNLFCFCMMMFSEYRGQISTVLCCYLVRQMFSVVYNLWYQPKINARKLGIFGTKKGHINCGGHVLWNPVLVRDSRETILFLHGPIWIFGPEAWSMNFELNKNKKRQQHTVTLFWLMLDILI